MFFISIIKKTTLKHISTKCVNNVITFKNSVTQKTSVQFNLVFSKFTKKMKEKSNKLNPAESQADNSENNNLLGYPIYPDSEDIYNNFQEEEEINPEETSKTKEPNSTNALRRKNLDDEFGENDFDIPGSELDDLQEDTGNEDEENNYYSLGGDDHLDLEEDQGE